MIDPKKYQIEYFVLYERRDEQIRSYNDDFLPHIPNKNEGIPFFEQAKISRYNYSSTFLDQIKESPFIKTPYSSRKIHGRNIGRAIHIEIMNKDLEIVSSEFSIKSNKLFWFRDRERIWPDCIKPILPVLHF